MSSSNKDSETEGSNVNLDEITDWFVEKRGLLRGNFVVYSVYLVMKENLLGLDVFGKV